MVQALIKRQVEEILSRPPSHIRNGTPGQTGSYQLFDNDGNLIGTFGFLRTDIENVIGSYINNIQVGSYTENIDVEKLEGYRRQEREEVFASTLDTVNPWWERSLSETQREAIGTWRQTWLDYPETGIKPTQEWEELLNGD